MRKPLLKLLIFPILFSGIISSCTTDPDLSKVPEISFSSRVQPILASHCNFAGCHGHGGGSYSGESEFSLETYNDVMGVVSAGDARGSKLYQVITRRGFVEERMPPSGYEKVKDEDVKLIYLWIEQGAKNN